MNFEEQLGQLVEKASAEGIPIDVIISALELQLMACKEKEDES